MLSVQIRLRAVPTFRHSPLREFKQKKAVKNWCKRAVHNAKSEAHEMKGPPFPESARRAYINVFFPFFPDRFFFRLARDVVLGNFTTNLFLAFAVTCVSIVLRSINIGATLC